MKTDEERKVVTLTIKEVIKSKTFRAGQKLKILKLTDRLVASDDKFQAEVATTLARRLKHLAMWNE